MQLDDDSVTGISTIDSVATPTSSHPQLRPILVGYAFGPKKMSTMGIIMAEASKATPVTADIPGSIETTMQEDPSSPSPSESKKRAASLTTAALETQSKKPRGVKLSMSGGPTGSGLRNIVRYFRSSCSSVATSEDTSTTATASNSLVPPSSSTTSSPRHHHPFRVSFVPLDLDSPLEEQHGGELDAILHKLTEDILCLSIMQNKEEDSSAEAFVETQVQSITRVNRLNQYQRDHPQCCLIDHPSHVQVVMSRSDIAHVLRQCLVGVTSTSGTPVRTPRFQVVTRRGDGACETELNLPLIAKPLQAAGTKKSHRMGIVSRRSGLSKVDTPCLLQEYANHNATLFKVYVLGSHVSVFQRPSLPNLPVHDCSGLYDYVEFDSQRPYPTLRDFGCRADSAASTTCSSWASPTPRANFHHFSLSVGSCRVSVEEIRPVVQVLREAFGLELFGFDILVTASSLSSSGHPSAELLVVDVNYFPSYKEVSNFPSLLANYLTQRAIQGRVRQRPPLPDAAATTSSR